MTRARDIASGLGPEAGEGKPHIIPGVLYPAVSGNDINGTDIDTSHGSTYTYGTAHADGRKYYYTDIKGSKPIKDPRIGAHFGSQRHYIRSLQLLEQETATHGDEVYSADGREWWRVIGASSNSEYMSHGHFLVSYHTIEIVGYFNDVNLGIFSEGGRQSLTFFINGVQNVASHNFHNATVASPLLSRYLSANSQKNCGLSGVTLGINTFKITTASTATNANGYIYNVELIAQDTSNRSNIQIPSQNVVSYGKKFTVSGTPHYNPFAFKTDGTTAWTSGNHNGTAWPVGTGASANIDTATSLGLSAWISTNHYYPYNGGRVVWWVDSSGTLKCSVNMMPPNARSIANSASLTNGTEKGDDSAGTSSAAVANNTFYPTFTDQAIDHSQAEVAKTFHWREFGNGSANGNTNYRDATTLNTASDLAYVMDDGLTSLTSNGLVYNGTALNTTIDADGNSYYLTFIGTGITIHRLHNSATQDPSNCIAQNLPYGTHVLQVKRVTWDTDLEIYIDGVKVRDGAGSGNNLPIGINEATFHQPKRPPIPEDAVILADYMLMADYVKQTSATAGGISKGVRNISGSRDWFYDNSGSNAWTGTAVSAQTSTHHALRQTPHNSGTATTKINFFGTTGQASVSTQEQAWTITLGGSGATENKLDSSVDSSGDVITIDETVALGSTNMEVTCPGGYLFWGGAVATPIHTSHHYQSFETPFLHELIGGDRNMEQTNLICTPDGRSWDEVTRDTSYIGNLLLTSSHDSGSHTSASAVNIFDEWRGESQTGASIRYNFNKDFAIAYDRIITLKSGQYTISIRGHTGEGSAVNMSRIYVNGVQVSNYDHTRSTYNQVILNLVRGDYIQILGYTNNDFDLNYIQIVKV